MTDKPSKDRQSRTIQATNGLDEQRLRTISQQLESWTNRTSYLYNPDFKATTRRPHRFTESAVLLPIINRSELSLLFTHRADHLPNHAGEISFPGGKADVNDDSLIATALRETEEELGISIDSIEILGKLPTLKVLSGFAITPIVGLVHPSFPMQLNENEVKGVFEAPLDHCLDAANFSFQETYHQGEQRAFFSLEWKEWTIWGATAAILHGLSQMITQLSTSESPLNL